MSETGEQQPGAPRPEGLFPPSNLVLSPGTGGPSIFRGVPDVRGDAASHFLSESQREAARTIRSALAERSVFVALTGKQGLGKTLLLKAVFTQPDTPGRILKLADPSKVSHAQVEQVLAQPAPGKRHTALFVDDAHTASEELLAFLARMAADRAGPQVVLAGRPELWDRLAHPDLTLLAARLVLRPTLRPFTDEDTRGLIRHLLEQPRRSSQRLTEAAEAEVMRLGAGRPERIGQFMRGTLMLGDIQSRPPIPAEVVRSAAAVIEGRRLPERRRWREDVIAVVILLVLMGGASLAMHGIPAEWTETAARLAWHVMPGQAVTDARPTPPPAPDARPNRAAPADTDRLATASPPALPPAFSPANPSTASAPAGASATSSLVAPSPPTPNLPTPGQPVRRDISAATLPSAAPAPPAATGSDDGARSVARTYDPAVPAQAAMPRTLLLRLAGSDAVGNMLARRLASGYLSLIGDIDISILPSGSERMIEVGGMQTGQRETITIASGSSASGFAALLRGSADIAMTVRKISALETERLSALGDTASPTTETVIGIQGIVAVVNPANRVSALTVPQLRSILAGRTTDWSQVGGAPRPIDVYAVDDQGGSADVPQDLVLSHDDVSAAATKIASEQALAAAVTADPGGIGFVTSGRTGDAKLLAVADAGGAAVTPSDLSISTESYPLSRRLYLYTVPGSSNLFIGRFAAYVTSAGGQAVVEVAGMVPLTVRAEAASVPDAAPERFKQLVAGATRLSIDFRFQVGSLELDGRGMRDLDRLAAYLKSQRVNPSRIILAGFADNSSTPAANQLAAQRQTEAVATDLNRAGVTPGKTATFGSELPVADNATPEGRERNRRVEVYLAPS